MTRKLISFILTLCLLASVAVGGFAEETDYDAIYAPVLDGLYHTMTCSPEEWDWDNDSTGILEVCRYNTTADVLQYIGYTITDVNSDGIPELLICDVEDKEAKELRGKYIYSLYTCVDGEPTKVFDGWFRNQFFALPDGSFFNTGSGGAAYHITALYQLAPNGTALECLDYYFTAPIDESMENVAVFYNSVGEFDQENSQQPEMSLDDLWQMEEIYNDMVVDFPLTSFADVYGIPSTVVARMGEAGQVLLTANWGDVTDMKLLEIRCTEGSDWTVTYEIVKESDYGTLHESDSLDFFLEFPGDLPTNAISYTDSVGTHHTYTLNLSGENGELILGEF